MKLSLFCCSTRIEIDEIERSLAESDDFTWKVIGLPCSGKVEMVYLVKAFETGADGVAVVTCGDGDCRYLEGNLRAKKRVKAVDDLLSEIGLEKDRITVIQLGEGGVEDVLRRVREFADGLRMLPSPARESGHNHHGV
jgi:F420-non-reducing hydrogenase iron-sulfur subunit